MAFEKIRHLDSIRAEILPSDAGTRDDGLFGNFELRLRHTRRSFGRSRLHPSIRQGRALARKITALTTKPPGGGEEAHRRWLEGRSERGASKAKQRSPWRDDLCVVRLSQASLRGAGFFTSGNGSSSVEVTTP